MVQHDLTAFARRLLAGVDYLRRSRGPRDVVLAFALPVLLTGMAQAFASSLSSSLLHLGLAGSDDSLGGEDGCFHSFPLLLLSTAQLSRLRCCCLSVRRRGRAISPARRGDDLHRRW